MGWYFYVDELAIIGNGSNFKFAFNPNPNLKTYQIADDISSKLLHPICEYQSMLYCFFLTEKTNITIHYL